VETESRRRGADLRQAADEWRQTFDALDLGTLLADPDGHVIRLNRKALELVAERSSLEVVIGKTLDVLSAAEPWGSLARLRADLPPDGASLGEEARDAATGRLTCAGRPWSRRKAGLPGPSSRSGTSPASSAEQLRNARLRRWGRSPASPTR
jgi:PAS domain-containing protein